VSGGSPRRTFDVTPGSAHDLVVGLVPPGARVLEFGCATGYMSEVLTKRLGCAVTGVELSPEAAESAREHCEKVVVGDAETLDLERVLDGAVPACRQAVTDFRSRAGIRTPISDIDGIGVYWRKS
jgi:SAM-dependent methyltransferase